MIDLFLPKQFQKLFQTKQFLSKGSQHITSSNQKCTTGSHRMNQYESFPNILGRANSEPVLSTVTASHYFRMNSQDQKRNEKNKKR